MAFPTTGILDDFNRADNADISVGEANWVEGDVHNGVDAFEIVSNQLHNEGANGVFAEAYWNVSFGPDSEVFVTTINQPTADSNNIFLFLRMAQPGTNTVDGYLLQFRHLVSATDEWEILEVSDDVETLLGATETGPELVDNDGIGFEAIGSTLTMYHRSGLSGSWDSQFNRTDSTHTGAGFISIGDEQDSAVDDAFDDFGGGTVVTVTVAEMVASMVRGYNPSLVSAVSRVGV